MTLFILSPKIFCFFILEPLKEIFFFSPSLTISALCIENRPTQLGNCVWVGFLPKKTVFGLGGELKQFFVTCFSKPSILLHGWDHMRAQNSAWLGPSLTYINYWITLTLCIWVLPKSSLLPALVDLNTQQPMYKGWVGSMDGNFFPPVRPTSPDPDGTSKICPVKEAGRIQILVALFWTHLGI